MLIWGLDQPGLAGDRWYKDPHHPYVQAISALLDELIAWPDIDHLEFLVSDGGDPFMHLKVRLDQQIFPWALSGQNAVTPGDVCQHLKTQRIYVFSQHNLSA